MPRLLHPGKSCLAVRMASAALASAALASAPAHAIDLTALPGLVLSSSYDYPAAGPANGPKANILDNQLTTYWNGGALSGWVQVDFGQTFAFDRIELYGSNLCTWRPGGGCPNNYTLFASDDGVHFTTVASGAYFYDTTLATPHWGAHHDFAAATAPAGRYLRYYAAGGPEWAHLGELEVQGHVPTPAVPEPGGWALMAAGLGALGFVARRKSR